MIYNKIGISNDKAPNRYFPKTVLNEEELLVFNEEEFVNTV